jgi:hypothetical protein
VANSLEIEGKIIYAYFPTNDFFCNKLKELAAAPMDVLGRYVNLKGA